MVRENIAEDQGCDKNVTAGHDCTVVVVAQHWVDGERKFAIAGGCFCLGLSCTSKELDK